MIQAVAQRVHQVFVACVLGMSLVSAPAVARQAPAFVNSPLSPITLAELPVNGRLTYERILAGGPFPYDKDGTVFGNRERLLPLQKRGFYREYTVRTPGVRGRGAKRIVCGGRSVQLPEQCYYSADHYNSFRPIQP